MRFLPPSEGLLSNENVVWARKQGIGFWIPFFSIFLLVGGCLLIVFSFGFAGVYRWRCGNSSGSSWSVLLGKGNDRSAKNQILSYKSAYNTK